MYIAGRVVAVPLSNLALTGSWQQTARPWQSAFPGSLLCAFKQIDCSGHVVLLWSVYVPPPPTPATTTVKLSAMELGGSGWCGLELQWHVFDSNADHGTCFVRKPRWWIWRRIRWDRQSGENGGEKWYVGGILSWRWRHYFLSKRLECLTELHGATRHTDSFRR